MSVTLVLVPASISANLLTALISSVALTVGTSVKLHKEIEEDRKNYSLTNLDSMLVRGEMSKYYEKNVPKMICSQYKTIFKDKRLLIKTVSEHGLQNIMEQDGKIYGNMDSLQFEFETDSNGVYIMNITHKESEDLSFVEDLNEEYQMNVQELSYMNIKKNLEKQNLTIDSEEILEDNSIMLTINLE